MAHEPPSIISTDRRVVERLTRIRAHTNGLRRRLRCGSEAERAVMTGYLDAIDKEVAAVAVLIQELRDTKAQAPASESSTEIPAICAIET